MLPVKDSQRKFKKNSYHNLRHEFMFLPRNKRYKMNVKIIQQLISIDHMHMLYKYNKINKWQCVLKMFLSTEDINRNIAVKASLDS